MKSSWFLPVLCVVVCLTGIVDRDLWTPDEPRVAAISVEMTHRGNVLVPHLGGEPFVEKPPLYFTVASLFTRMFGRFVGNAGAVRLSSAVWGLGILLATFLLARRLMGGERAILAVAFLGTMWGFVVECAHWIRVDSALCFFVAASIWSFAEVYMAERKWFCAPAAVAAGCAFLAKGLVGPVFIGVAWLAMVVPWLRRRERRIDLYVLPHLIGLAAFLFIVLGWMLAFRSAGGEELWREWFVENHLGRLTGKAAGLGHLKPAKPFYYLGTIAVFTLPWLPLVMLWVARVLRRIITGRGASDALSKADVLLAVWCAGMTFILSLSTTKRDLYLAPLLPAFAMMCADAALRGIPRWCKYFLHAWLGVVLVILAGLALSPLWAGAQIPERAVVLLSSVTPRHVVVLCCFVTCLYVLARRVKNPVRVIVVTAFLYIGLFALPFKAVDLEKSMALDTRQFAGSVVAPRRSRVAGHNLSETLRACLYYYEGWPIPLVDHPRLKKIVAGDDAEFDSVLVAREYRDTPSLAEIVRAPYEILATGIIGNKREIYLIRGKR